MSAGDLNVTSRTNDDHVEISVTGEIDLANASAFEEHLANAITNHAVEVCVDLSGVEFIDSAGMRALVALAYRLQTAQIRLHLHAPDGSLARRVLMLSGLESLIHPDADR
ncbi:MAG TPA: STAS domain-containing protein [Acidimicrobiales bacterium]|jgi:stage II sporulation protein AA (anti-sigma F factor antagonist)|nr:STAS domain-containing protein [Acidimicrobiales bacterium]